MKDLTEVTAAEAAREFKASVRQMMAIEKQFKALRSSRSLTTEQLAKVEEFTNNTRMGGMIAETCDWWEEALSDIEYGEVKDLVEFLSYSLGYPETFKAELGKLVAEIGWNADTDEDPPVMPGVVMTATGIKGVEELNG